MSNLYHSLQSTPQYFGPYQIEQPIAEGGFGRVYRVNYQGQIYALKVLHALDAESVSRFEREAKMLLKTGDLPGFAKIYACGLDPQPHILMEYIEAPNIEQWLAQNQSKTESKIEIIRQVTSAINQLHQLDIVHRDLKTENILIREDPTTKALDVVIIDFGLATGSELQSLTQSQQFLGTPRTMAPEQWEGGPFSRKATVDVWAIGVIAYYLATGKHLVSGSPIQIFGKIRKLDIKTALKTEDAGEIGPFESLITSCLQVDPENRAQSASEVIETLYSNDKAHKTARIKATFAIALALVAVIVGAMLLFLTDTNENELKLRAFVTANLKAPTQSSGSTQPATPANLDRILTDYFLTKISPELGIIAVEERKTLIVQFSEANEALKALQNPRLDRTFGPPIRAGIFCLNQQSTLHLERSLKTVLNLSVEANSKRPRLFKNVEEIVNIAILCKSNRFTEAFLLSQANSALKSLNTPQEPLNSHIAIQRLMQFLTASSNQIDQSIYDILDLIRSNSIKKARVEEALNELIQQRLKQSENRIRALDPIITRLILAEVGFRCPWLSINPTSFERYIQHSVQKMTTISDDDWSEYNQATVNYIYLQSFYKEQTGNVTDPVIPPVKLMGRFASKSRKMQGFDRDNWSILVFSKAIEVEYFDEYLIYQSRSPLLAFFDRYDLKLLRQRWGLYGTRSLQQLNILHVSSFQAKGNYKNEELWGAYVDLCKRSIEAKIDQVSPAFKAYLNISRMYFIRRLLHTAKTPEKRKEAYQLISKLLKLPNESGFIEELFLYIDSIIKPDLDWVYLIEHEKALICNYLNEYDRGVTHAKACIEAANKRIQQRSKCGDAESAPFKDMALFNHEFTDTTRLMKIQLALFLTRSSHPEQKDEALKSLRLPLIRLPDENLTPENPYVAIFAELVRRCPNLDYDTFFSKFPSKTRVTALRKLAFNKQ